MVKVKISNDHIEISGHAMYSDNDIVCAAISSIVITSVNAILRFDKQSIIYKQSDGYINIDIIKHTREVDTLISNMTSLLYELESQYKKNIKIYKEEK